jgi:ribosomal protein S6E (S10)
MMLDERDALERSRLGGSHHHAARSCQRHLAICHRPQHKGIRRLGRVRGNRISSAACG